MNFLREAAIEYRLARINELRLWIAAEKPSDDRVQLASNLAFEVAELVKLVSEAQPLPRRVAA